MPATLPTPIIQNITNYTPALAAAVTQLYEQGDAQLTIPVTFALADAAPLFVVPTVGDGRYRISIARAFWEVTVSWTGGASSAIGVSSTNASYNTKGDLLGGAAGDVAAGLTAAAPIFKGTIGAKATNQGVIVLVPGDIIRFDRITSAFTAGAALLHIPVNLIPLS